MVRIKEKLGEEEEEMWTEAQRNSEVDVEVGWLAWAFVRFPSHRVTPSRFGQPPA